MQEESETETQPDLSETMHAIVDRMLSPFGKTSPRGIGLLAAGLPPIDVSKPNQHNSKAEFFVEYEAVTKSYD